MKPAGWSLPLVLFPLALAAATPPAPPPPDPATLPPPARAVVPRLEGKVTFDGELTESVWARAARLGPFRPASGQGEPREATFVRVWHDGEALYLGWECSDADIQATFTARDSRFWEEEVVEFFVTRDDLTRYYELQWNPLGGEFDAIITNDLDARGVSRSFKGDWSYTAKGMRSAVKVRGTVQKSGDRDQDWRVEARIPFADLGGPAPRAKRACTPGRAHPARSQPPKARTIGNRCGFGPAAPAPLGPTSPPDRGRAAFSVFRRSAG